MKKYIILMIGIYWMLSCSTSTEESLFEYRIPEQINDGWEVSSLTQEGIDQAKIVDLMERILNNEFNDVHGFLIVKNGRLVLEEYLMSYHRDIKHDIASCTKSITSALIGIAFDQGLLNSIQQKLFGFFPEYGYLKNPDNDKIKLIHLLAMTAGFEWDENSTYYTDPSNSYYQMYTSGNWIQHVLERPMADEPGTVFVYNSGCAFLLSGIIKKATGMQVDQWAKTNLFDPLGISEYEWDKQNDGLVNTGGALKLRPRDMAKFGSLYLNEGVWQGRQIVSKEWIMESTEKRIGVAKDPGYDYDTGYGYLWWVQSGFANGIYMKSYNARGYGGQYIIIFPAVDMVIVFTQNNPGDSDLTLSMVFDYILPSVL